MVVVLYNIFLLQFVFIFNRILGGSRVNDFFEIDFEQNEWKAVTVLSGVPPSARHSHSAVVYKNSIYIFGG